ncbi:substrate-binding domain-containing protein [Gordonia hydrophobica]|uniref:LysR substrate-binding domain-containing protein n=1 Tax=Gordonia hydrophobica TaxID=40516 RepID=A0ABZ2U4L0_9ACTN|nr:LysR substrate-binding domain-containing protein [Gordonia hydrophobica]MBM7368270.1 DNA-binding transcriptional LysR family regulator [Gordonia hydrophobica]
MSSDSQPTAPEHPAEPTRFRLAYVPGVMPAKWVRKWEERFTDIRLDLTSCSVADSAVLVRNRGADAVVTRMPRALDLGDPGPHHVIELYEETTVVVVPKDHYLTLADDLSVDDLADEKFLLPLDDVLDWAMPPGTVLEHRPETVAAAVELVAAGMGLVAVPQSLARLHHRRDLVYRPLRDAPTSRVVLLWPSPTTDLADEFVGIVRGRRAGSSRGRDQQQPKRTAKEKAAAKRANREAAGKVPGKNFGKGARRGRR